MAQLMKGESVYSTEDVELDLDIQENEGSGLITTVLIKQDIDCIRLTPYQVYSILKRLEELGSHAGKVNISNGIYDMPEDCACDEDEDMEDE